MSDVPPKFRREILEAIEGLRIRKTRPNEGGIVKYVSRKWGYSLNEVTADLERLVDEDAVQKVDYKGSVSYRDTAKWIHAGTSSAMLQLPVQFGCLLNSQITTSRIMSAMEKLSAISANAASKMVALPKEVIERHLSSTHPNTKLRGEHLMKCLLREVDIGRLVQLTNEAFVLSNKVDRSAKVKREGLKRPPQKPKNSLAKGSGNGKKRNGSAVARDDDFEPEEQPVKKQKPNANDRLSPSQKFPKFSNTFPNGKKAKPKHCFECVDAVGMDKAKAGFLLECTVCSYACHPSCAGYPEETVQLVADSFTCISCKKCKICDRGKLGDDPDLVLCVRCDNAFHYRLCHIPPLTIEQAARADWRCADCKVAVRSGKKAPPFSRKVKEVISTNSVRRPSGIRAESSIDSDAESSGGSNNSAKNGRSSKTDEEMSEIIAEAIKCFQQSLPPQKTTRLVSEIETWTVQDIAGRFEADGHSSFAEVIRKQDIDGYALMLLAREDVVTRFGLPFVDAVKMYREICRLCPFGPYSE